MILPIDEKWRIKSDAYCWHVQRYEGMRPNRQTGEPEEYWKSKRYYANIAQAAYGLAELEIMTSDCTTLAEALDRVRDVAERLSTEQGTAALISAAPDLFEALAAIVNDLPINRDWLNPDYENMAYAAIAKAKGES